MTVGDSSTVWENDPQIADQDFFAILQQSFFVPRQLDAINIGPVRGIHIGEEDLTSLLRNTEVIARNRRVVDDDGVPRWIARLKRTAQSME